jgi:cbb3-type cytochrome oxidase subunit 3
MVSLIAIIPLVGAILLLYCQAFLTADVQNHADRQKAHNHFFQQGLMKVGKISQPFHEWQPLPKRDTAAYTILTILTVGFFLPYWWYVNIQDMNAHLKSQSEYENRLVQLLQAEG